MGVIFLGKPRGLSDCRFCANISKVAPSLLSINFICIVRIFSGDHLSDAILIPKQIGVTILIHKKLKEKKMPKKKVTVLGAGHWGMALASVMDESGASVTVWARNENEAQRINTLHVSKYFENYVFSPSIVCYTDIDACISDAEYVVIATPVHALDSIKPYVLKYSDKKFLITCKGLFDGDVLTDYLRKDAPKLSLAVLSGPSFSEEIIHKKITAVVVASRDAELAVEFRNLFHTEYFRPYSGTDEVGVQLCGAVKNIYAICAGLADGKYASSNMKSGLLTRALAEMEKLVTAMGGKMETLLGLAGVGDLMLSCHSQLSRNYTFGLHYSGDTETSVTTEGIKAAAEFYALAEKNGIDMPIVNSLYNTLYRKADFCQEVSNLMKRTLKDEFLQ